MIVFDSYGTVSDIEIFWVVIAAVGFCFSVLNVRDALNDVRALYLAPPYEGSWTPYQIIKANFTRGPIPRKPILNGRFALAWAQARVETARLIIQGIFIAIGLVAMFIPNADTSHLTWKYVVIGAMFRWGFITCSLLVTYQSIENRRARRHILSLPAEGGQK